MSASEPIDFAPVDLDGLDPQEAASRVIAQAAEARASDLFLLSDEGSVAVSMRSMGQVERLARRKAVRVCYCPRCGRTGWVGQMPKVNGTGSRIGICFYV